MEHDSAIAAETAYVTANGAAHDAAKWHCAWELRKYWGDIDPENPPAPYEIVEGEGNLLVTVGITLLLNLLIGAGGTVYSNANCKLGVGDGTTAAAIGDTDLSAIAGATHQFRQAADATFPSVATNVLTLKATFSTANGNFHWQEWGIFNTATAGSGMLNHAVVDLGTKTSAASWALTVTITIT